MPVKPKNPYIMNTTYSSYSGRHGSRHGGPGSGSGGQGLPGTWETATSPLDVLTISLQSLSKKVDLLTEFIATSSLEHEYNKFLMVKKTEGKNVG